jgi:hypothetical protein
MTILWEFDENILNKLALMGRESWVPLPILKVQQAQDCVLGNFQPSLRDWS